MSILFFVDPPHKLMEKKKELKTPISNLALFIRCQRAFIESVIARKRLFQTWQGFLPCQPATALCLRYNCWFSSVCIINHEIVFVFFSSRLLSLFFRKKIISQPRRKKCLEDLFYWDRTGERNDSPQRLTSVHLFIYFISILVLARAISLAWENCFDFDDRQTRMEKEMKNFFDLDLSRGKSRCDIFRAKFFVWLFLPMLRLHLRA